MEIEAAARYGVVERHLDLILAEEFKFNAPLIRWIFDQAQEQGKLWAPGGVRLDGRVPKEMDVHVGLMDDVGASDAGENDLEVIARWPDGSHASLLIEDKLTATFQPDQGLRYSARVTRRVSPCAAVLVAPQSFLDRHGTEQATWFALVAVESIAKQLDIHAREVSIELASRLTWRAAALRGLRQPRPPAPSDSSVEAVREWLCERLADRTPSAQPDRSSMRTSNAGWLYFVDPPSLVYKMQHGVVDIYLRDIWPDDVGRQAQAHEGSERLPHGFQPALDTKDNLILRTTVHDGFKAREAWNANGLCRVDDLAAAVEACGAGIDWIRSVEAAPHS